MPPQDETAVVEQSAVPAGSYWDEPPEKKLEGKTLSSLELSGLEKADHGNHEDPSADGKPAAAGSYWDEPEEQKLKNKTLSKLSLSGLGHAHEDPTTPDHHGSNGPAIGSYWDAPAEEQLKNKTLSSLSLTGLGHTEQGNHEEPQIEAKAGGDSPAAGSYWDEPEEQKLKNKRLSSLSLTGLGHAHEEPQADTKPDHHGGDAPAAGSYWDAPAEEQLKNKTLSSLSLTGLGHTDHGTHQEPQADTKAPEQAASGGSYWDEPEEDKLKGKTLSSLSLTGLGRHHEEGAKSSGGSPQDGGYWGWQENIKKTLSKLSLSDLMHGSSATATAAAETEPSTPESTDNAPASPTAKKEEPTTTIGRRPSGAGGYWFWRNPSTDKLTDGQRNVSEVSLETMEKNAKKSDRIEGQQGPISNLQHKMRSTWRASFARLSTNTLSALDEAPTTPAADPMSASASDMAKANGVTDGWREDFSDKESVTSMKRRDSFVVHEDEDGEDGMCF